MPNTRTGFESPTYLRWRARSIPKPLSCPGGQTVFPDIEVTRNTIRDWQGSAGNHLGLVLDDSPAPATPQSGALFFTGDQRAKLIGIETRLDLGPASARYNTYAWSETTWAADGTLVGGVGRVSIVDELTGTSNSIAACGHRTGVASLFGFKFGGFGGRQRCWRGRWGRADAQTERQPSLRPSMHAMQDARRSGARAPRRQSEVLR